MARASSSCLRTVPSAIPSERAASLVVRPLIRHMTAQLRRRAPVMPEVRGSALGTDAVVDGCLASGADLAWTRLTALLPSALPADGISSATVQVIGS